MKILHITDTHILADSGLHYGLVNTSSLLQQVVEHAYKQERCDAIVVSGDISDDGSPASYEYVALTLSSLAHKWSAPLIVACGNHDDRASLREVFSLPGTSGEPINYVKESATHRFIVADTSVPRAGWGFLGETTEWIEQQLTHEKPAILVLHHPPTTPPTTLHSALRLTDAPQLARMLAHLDIKPLAILAGHYHVPALTTLAGIPVIVGAAVANLTSLIHGVNCESATRGSAYTVVNLGHCEPLETAPIVHTHWVQQPTSEELFFYDSEAVSKIIDRAGRPDYQSRSPLHWTGAGSEFISHTQG